ncbi:DUF4179 domain-containing protein [Terrisporobacter mayombei]|uniref:DUF4179 domain-containing protein n=1 Tax=Terrisporobacter mayombei TaxID=1541 RepID=A0ABY9PXE5_9FIRM|nr:DUF4179 domain-containing protein [Terrisporobacter mayombei]MCC3868223.1 DUF4179 domain-containing protein [Terrisporobacter mayombei]WMT80363.1 hypothetical protein TEMA_06790 [Terrisporobacter mayombei]
MNKNNKIIDDNTIPDCVNIKIDEARNLIRKENIKKKRIKNACLSVAAVVVIFLGVTILNPTLANKVPFLGNIINTLKEDKVLSEKEPFIKNINSKNGSALNKKVISKDIGITVQEAYCDGSNIYISYLLESENRHLDDMERIDINDVVNDGDIMASFSNEKLQIDNTVSKKIDKNTYAIIQSIDLMPLVTKGVDVKPRFNLSINISKVKGYTSEGGDKIVKGHWNYNIEVKKDDSKNIAYEPNLENNKFKLKKILLTPNTTEIEIDIPRNASDPYILAYDDKGKLLENLTFSYNLESDLGMLQYEKFTPISKDSEYILIQVIDKSKYEKDVLSEFKVPLK